MLTVEADTVSSCGCVSECVKVCLRETEVFLKQRSIAKHYHFSLTFEADVSF